MLTCNIISLVFIEEREFVEKLKKAGASFGFPFVRDGALDSEFGVHYFLRNNGDGERLEVTVPKLRRFNETSDWNVEGYGTLTSIDFDAKTDDGLDLIFQVLFEFAKSLEDALIITDAGDRIFLRTNIGENELYIKSSDYNKGDVVY